ncbi:ribosomal protein L11 methyltransferase [Acrasis kona]|uniref:Ribosomal protein L11 methyltransferase n=1 Tax=Acrasis kona TaxID=1008807 RepID=A0AAW2ZN83_9EUKA
MTEWLNYEVISSKVLAYLPVIIAAGTYGGLQIKEYLYKKEISKKKPGLFEAVAKLSSKDPIEIKEALDTISQVNKGTGTPSEVNEVRAAIVDAGALKQFSRILKDFCNPEFASTQIRTEVTNNVIRIMYSLVNNKARNRDYISSHGCVETLAKLLFAKDEPELDHVTHETRRLCYASLRHYTKFAVEERVLSTDIPKGSDGASVLAHYLTTSHFDAIKEELSKPALSDNKKHLLSTLAHISYISAGLDKLIENDVDKHLIQFLSNDSELSRKKKVKHVAILAIGNMCNRGDAELTGALSRREELLNVLLGMSAVTKEKVVTGILDIFYFVTKSAVDAQQVDKLELISKLFIKNNEQSRLLFERRLLHSTSQQVKDKVDYLANIYTNKMYVPESHAKIADWLNTVKKNLITRQKHQQQLAAQQQQANMMMQMGMMGGMPGMPGMGMGGMPGDDEEEDGMSLTPEQLMMMQRMMSG